MSKYHSNLLKTKFGIYAYTLHRQAGPLLTLNVKSATHCIWLPFLKCVGSQYFLGLQMKNSFRSTKRFSGRRWKASTTGSYQNMPGKLQVLYPTPAICFREGRKKKHFFRPSLRWLILSQPLWNCQECRGARRKNRTKTSTGDNFGEFRQPCRGDHFCCYILGHWHV